jgi:hypothetical protein
VLDHDRVDRHAEGAETVTADQPEHDATESMTRRIQVRADELVANGFSPEDAWIQAAIEHYPALNGPDRDIIDPDTVETLATLFRQAFRLRREVPGITIRKAWDLAVRELKNGAP